MELRIIEHISHFVLIMVHDTAATSGGQPDVL